MIETPPVDPGEELLARTGIRHALFRETSPLWLRKTAEPLEKQIRAKVAAFTTEKPRHIKVKLPEFDYDDVLAHLTSTKPMAPESLARLDGDVASGYLVAVQRAIRYLSDQLPKSTITDMVSTRNVRPSDLTIAVFRRIFAVAQDPMVALTSLVDGTLTQDQVAALIAMFPGVYAAARAILFEEITNRLASDLEWHLPYSRDQLLQVFTQTPAGDAAAAARLQQNFADAKARKAVEQADEPKTPSKGLAKSVETPVQRASQ